MKQEKYLSYNQVLLVNSLFEYLIVTVLDVTSFSTKLFPEGAASLYKLRNKNGCRAHLGQTKVRNSTLFFSKLFFFSPSFIFPVFSPGNRPATGRNRRAEKCFIQSSTSPLPRQKLTTSRLCFSPATCRTSHVCVSILLKKKNCEKYHNKQFSFFRMFFCNN